MLFSSKSTQVGYIGCAARGIENDFYLKMEIAAQSK